MQSGTLDCGPAAALFLLAAVGVDMLHGHVARLSPEDIVRACQYLRARMAVDMFAVSEENVRMLRTDAVVTVSRM